MTCANCPKKAQTRSGLCWRCLKYRQRHDRLPSEPPQTYGNKWQTVRAAWFALFEADTSAKGDADFDRLEARVRMAMKRWAEHQQLRSGGQRTMSNK